MIQNVIETIRNAFQTRDFNPFVALFAADGVYETPFATENKRIAGIAAIGAHFAKMTESPINKAMKIESVSASSIPGADGMTVFVSFEIKGKRLADGQSFHFPSSVALLYIEGDKIKVYRDYPNVAGIRQAAGLSFK
ncbi:nuclear transport factor 2 family protein [Mucilaginibacter corticis]|uniref:Nuclear transport factor 2 family protein n=1 Tax=Mucilaginibacter corticis TaxID=2597670 RepID=A0A556M7S3_9SPHI|nr:nuclear transport factor 2 family protein [Mucilaginibacter corticis]TSJ35934.1 nuclear transport factor 2 family protein [Mucilaginibacter corticis]